MNAAPAKFTFDVDMGRNPAKRNMLTDEKLAEMLAAAREEGRAEGHREGEQSAVAKAAQAQQRAMETLLQNTTRLLGGMDAVAKKATGDATLLGKSVAAKLAPAMIEKEPTAELDGLLAECMASLGNAPHLLIRCHQDIADALRETAESHMATSGFTGRLVVMGEPDIALGDGRIEWADGGVARDSSAIMAQIEEKIQSYLAARGVPVAEENEQ